MNGHQKLMAENLLKIFAKTLQIKVAILRISTAYGFDERYSDQGVINKWIKCAISGDVLDLYNTEDSLINFISLEQIANAIDCCIENEVSGTINIGSSESTSLKEIIEEISKVSDRNLSIRQKDNKYRNFQLSTDIFYNKTGILFKNRAVDDIKYLYNKINKSKR